MNGRKVLIVDDEEDIRAILKRRLENRGITCITAANGVEAIEMARREKPALILLDLLMPKMDGMQASRILKADDETKNISIIAYTSYGPEIAERKMGDMKGILSFAAKPFDHKALLSLVEQALTDLEGAQ